MKKKYIALLCAFPVCLTAFGIHALAAGNSLPSDTVILVPAAANTYEQAAARRLQARLSEQFGISPEIVTEAAGAFEISVGETGRIDAGLAGKPDGSYVIRAYPGGVALCGAGVRGNINAVYRFLEEFGGCKVYTGAMGMTKGKTAISVPADADISYTPYFEYTDTDWRSPRGIEYSLMNGLNGGPYRQIPAEYGGSVNYISGFCHTLATQFCSRNTYYASHPEYFAIHDGERTDRQLCLTNENVYQIVRQEVLDLLASRHDPGAALQIVSLTQDDNQQYCECPACKALDEKNGSHAGTMITFVNRIARDVAAAGYDNVGIDTFAYQYTRKAPANVRPEPNVIVRLCSIECCFSHALNDPTCKENANFIRDLEDWSRLSNRLYIWDYTTNYAHTVGPFPDFGVLQANMQCFYEHNVKGVYEEGNYYIDACDAEFGELRAYLLSKLLQDPYCDYDAEMDGFLKAYYGNAWRAIRNYIDRTTENAATTHVMIYEDMLSTFTFADYEIRELDAMWEAAKGVVQGEQLQRVLRSELSWRYWKASVGASEFRGTGDAANAARQQLVDDWKAFGITMLREGNNNDLHPDFMTTPARYWQDDPADGENAGRKFVLFTHYDLLLRKIGFFFEQLKLFFSKIFIR